MSAIARYLERLSAPPEEIRAANLRDWSADIEGTIPIVELSARKRGKVAGVIQNIRIDPREGQGSIEATISDGTGEMVAKWLGRSSLRGLRLGEGLLVEGMMGAGTDRELVCLNPEFHLVPGPEHG